MYIWDFILSQIIDMYQRGGYGEPYEPPSVLNEGIIRYTIISILIFVYDCNLSNTGTKHETVHNILKITTSDAQLWNMLSQKAVVLLN